MRDLANPLSHFGDKVQNIVHGGYERKHAWRVKHIADNDTWGFQNESSGHWLGVNEVGGSAGGDLFILRDPLITNG